LRQWAHEIGHLGTIALAKRLCGETDRFDAAGLGGHHCGPASPEIEVGNL
jgi:hypothetical protein